MSLTTVGLCMGDESVRATESEDAHLAAADAFVDKAQANYRGVITNLYVFGSTVRGDAHGLASDVDVLIVLDDTCDSRAIADALRDIALDVMIEFGPVVELHILSESTFEQHQRDGNPFIRNVVSEGQAYV